MLTKQNLINLDKELQQKNEVTKDFLKTNNFSEIDINQLIDEKIIKYNSNTYEAKDLNKLLVMIKEFSYTLEEKFLMVQNQNAIILLDNAEIDNPNLKDLLSENPQICLKVYENENHKIGIIQKKKLKLNKYQIRIINTKATKKYQNNDYEAAISFYKVIAQSNFKCDIYGKIGVCYLKLGNVEQAMNYLLMAKYACASLNQNTEVYTNLINKLNKLYKDYNLDNKDVKEKKENKKYLDYNKLLHNYDFAYSDNILNFINLFNLGYSLNDVCKSIKFSKEELQICKLLLAREYYINSLYSIGDNYLKQAQNAASKEVKNLYDEVRKHKLLYRHHPPQLRLQIKVAKNN